MARRLTVVNLKNGALRNLNLQQTNNLLEIIDGKVSERKRYLKVAILAALFYDCSFGKFYSSNEIAKRSQRYTNKNSDMSSSVAGNLLGMMYRMEILERTASPPYSYKLHERYRNE